MCMLAFISVHELIYKQLSIKTCLRQNQTGLQQNERLVLWGGGAVKFLVGSIWLVHIFSKWTLSLATAWPNCVPTPFTAPRPGQATTQVCLGPPGMPAPRRWAFTKHAALFWKVHPFLASPFLGSTRLLGLGPTSLGVSQLSTHNWV